MPMLQDDKSETVQRLGTAHKKTREVLESEPAAWDHAGAEIANNWTVITAAYSGLEQTVKYLIAEENDRTVPELIQLREGKARPFLTHHLCDLFLRLSEPTQQRLRDFYARFQSLHCYVETDTLDEFLSQISDEEGRGYERWRYTLTDDTPPPMISPEALLAIWGACVQIAEERVWKNQRLRMPEEALARELSETLKQIAMDVSVERQNAGEPFKEFSPEIRKWLWRTGHPLNAFADVLWHFSRYAAHGQTNVSERLAEALAKWADDFTASPLIARRTSVRRFVLRAQGDTPDGESIRWNRSTNRFEAVPWSLETRRRASKPLGAVAVGDPTPRRTPLSTLWIAARESGYRVLENRGFSARNGGTPWFCTHEVRTVGSNVGGTETVLCMWRQRNEHRGVFFMVEEQPRAEMGRGVRRWIEKAIPLGQMKMGPSHAE